MGLKRYFVDIPSDTVEITGEEYNHLVNVMRAKVGEQIMLCPNDGCDYLAEVVQINKKSAAAKVLSKTPNECEAEVRLTLIQSLLKGDKMELVAQKLTELGAAAFRPLATEFMQVKRDSTRLERLDRIILEAAKQCGRAVLPKCYPVTDIEGLDLSGYDLVIFAYEKEGEQTLNRVLDDAAGARNVAIIVGSEGGFSDSEAERLIAKGAKAVTLGNRIMRAETASIALTAAVMYGLGEWRLR